MKLKYGMIAASLLVLPSVMEAGFRTAKSARLNKKTMVRVIPFNKKTVELHEAMRELWAAHVIWTREYIVAALANAAETKQVAERLFKNQDDIGDAIKPYYGKDAGNQLAKLLREHIQIAADIVAAAKAKKDFKGLDKQWHDNADAIAKFLSSANPYWKFEELKGMLDDHLKLTTEELNAQLAQKWHQSISSFDTIFKQAMSMADALSDGIVKQFSDKF